MQQSRLPPARTNRRRRWWWRGVLALLLGAWVSTAWYQSRKPLPEGLRMASPWVTVADSDLRLLIDTTTSDAYGQPLVQQQIFDETLRIIGAARRFIVLNAHLFNPYLGELSDMRATRSLSRELRDALLTAKRTQPQLAILVIVDPVNDLYGSAPSADYAMLASAGIEIARTDLEPLRDSNALWSAAWRGLIRWWGHARSSPGWVPNPLAGGPRTVPLRAAARALNFKANHRKLLVADDGAGQYVALVGSANPHDASSLHTNIALALRGPAAEKVLDASLAVARFSGWRGSLAPPPPAALPAPRTTQLRLLTEGAIAEAIGERLGAARSGDQIMVTALYLADRGIIRAILAAAARGAQVRIVLDPNETAYGRPLAGIPNRPAAAELTAASAGAVQLRWYRTRSEQFHGTAIAVRSGERFWLTVGSANLTRRSLRDFNLEANVAVETSVDSALAADFMRWFDAIWFNRGPPGSEYSAEHGVYADSSQANYWAYRLMEASGLSSF